MAAYQQDLMEKHCEEVENMYRQTRGWRHDYRNHIQTMKAYLSMGRYEELAAYLDQLDMDLSQVDTVVKTGNVMVDAVLNSKISVARAKQITVEAKATVPRQLAVAEVDLCVILGNLLDNAIEACMGIKEESRRFIRIYIDAQCHGGRTQTPWRQLPVHESLPGTRLRIDAGGQGSGEIPRLSGPTGRGGGIRHRSAAASGGGGGGHEYRKIEYFLNLRHRQPFVHE